MPGVINGIGTWYYGKKNKQERPGVCESCGKAGTLVSYDTRLWFVIVFIPVFPLGKKHILDECPHCQRHRVAALKDWEKQKAEAIEKGLQKMAEAPDDPANAIALHRTYLFFGQRDDGAKLLAFMKERFPDDAKAQFYIGAALEFVGKDADAMAHFQRALELSPQMKEARRAVGLCLIEKDKPDEARELLRYMEESGADYESGVLYALARAYQRAVRHKEALELLRLILQRTPILAKDKEFRRAVKASELALGSGQSCLPASRWNARTAFACSVAAAAVLALCLAVNWYISRARTVHVVNGLDKPVTVAVAGAGTVQLAPGERKTLSLPEGTNHAVVTGAVQQEFDFTLTPGFLDRYIGKTVRVINPDGAALVYRETTVYSVTPTQEPNAYQFYYGQPFVEILEVDHPFEPFPKTVSLKDRHAHVYRSRVDIPSGSPRDLAISLMSRDRRAEALDMAEWQLRRVPDDALLLRSYLDYCLSIKLHPRAKAFLAANCKRRPIEVEWHRACQDAQQSSAEAPAVAAEYAALLKADPDNSALLYLYSRVCGGRKESMALIERALDKDPKNAFAWLAVSYHKANAADWQGAKDALSRAFALRPKDDEFARLLFGLTLIAGDLDALEKAVRKDVAARQFSVVPVEQLCEVLIAQNRVDAAKKECDECERRMAARFTSDPMGVLLRMRGNMLYQAGLFAELEKLVAGKQATARRLQFAVLVELGKLAEAEKVPAPAPPEFGDPLYSLALSIAWRHAGDTPKAQTCLEKGLAEFARNDRDGVRTAALLKQTTPPAVEDVTELTLAPRMSAVVYALLAQRFPDRAQEYLARVRLFNVDRDFPYHLLNRVAGAARPAEK